jgi:hypothetical protein
MSNIKSYLFLALIVSNFSCKDTSPQPTSYVGDYEVTLSFDDNIINKEEIQQDINDAVVELKEELSKAKTDMTGELNLNHIDTSTVEGKIEYASKKFGQSMAELGTDIGSLGAEMGIKLSVLAENSLNKAETLLNGVKFDVTLQADGDIKTSGPSVWRFGINDATWKVSEPYFLFQKDKDSKTDSLHIISQDNNGFSIRKDKFVVHLTKKMK